MDRQDVVILENLEDDNENLKFVRTQARSAQEE